MANLDPGLYDQLVDTLLRRQIDSLATLRLAPDLQTIDPAELPDRVGEVVGHWMSETLADVDPGDRAETALQLARSVLSTLSQAHAATADPDRGLSPPLERLTAVERLAPTDEPIQIRRPLTPLRDTVLMTNARGQPSVGHEIEAEIESADRIDVVLAFIRWTGVRHLVPHLRRHAESGKELRVITTTYTGSTELRALEALIELGAEVKVSYDTSTTRLHAKAWMFHRSSGFSTAYIGSSNLTFSAQVTGLEWNIRASQRLNPDLIAAFQRTFDTYWSDVHFEAYDRDRFSRATSDTGQAGSIVTPFAIEPYPFQRQILERLQVERHRGNPHNLIVAATGTGKTIIAALDYRNLRRELRTARLLFVAHRTEILEQSLTTFRHVLRDGSFGELWVGRHRPTQWEHVFASIQSITANGVSSFRPAQFDVLIIDEFHHAAAESYKTLLGHLRPKHRLGLTATPERADGLNILHWFGDRMAIELRLWDALEQGLLSPFHYFGVHDETNLTRVPWNRGTGYDTARLTNLYTANDIWVSKVLQAVKDKVAYPTAMRALGFCVSIDHARFMADRFSRAGIKSRAITSHTTEEKRTRGLSDLRAGTVQVLFTVDLFNEGVDIPEIDVVLMLRPTDSATIFLQQLGRGLRRTGATDVLTVLDFVGHQSKEFRFDRRYGGLLGRTRRELEADVQNGFPYLPAGCHLDLDPVARKIVLDNIRNALPTTWRRQAEALRNLGDIGLKEYLMETGLELEDIYRNGHCWTELRQSAGFYNTPRTVAAVPEEPLRKGIARTLHLDDQERIDTLRALLSDNDAPQIQTLSERDRRYLEGLLLNVLNPPRGRYAHLGDAAREFWQHKSVRYEILELLDVLETRVVHLHQPLGPLHTVPLQVHANYTLKEILASFGASTVVRPLNAQAGVYWHEATRTDLLFITLQKTESQYSPTTRYLDYAISEDLFHWETQARVTEDSVRCQNYIHHGSRRRKVALFIRATRQDAWGRTRPYFCAGTASYVEHRSERPVQITWRLDHPLPGDVFASYRAAVA